MISGNDHQPFPFAEDRPTNPPGGLLGDRPGIYGPHSDEIADPAGRGILPLDGAVADTTRDRLRTERSTSQHHVTAR